MKPKLLVCLTENFDHAGLYNIRNYLKDVETTLNTCVQQPVDMVFSFNQYMDLPPDQRYGYDIILTSMGPVSTKYIEDQAKNSKKLKWVQSLSAGVDSYCEVERFRDNDVILTNAKGSFGAVLAEFVAMGMLYHAKHLGKFLNRKKNKKWEPEIVEMLGEKHVVIVGYGDIGSHCARVAKNGFNCRVTGVRNDPSKVLPENRVYCDEIVGLDQYDRAIREADVVVGVLPRVPNLTCNFFNKRTFEMMKTTAIFINIGRGTTVKEDDLVVALKEGLIAGAVLDVYAEEPLDPKSALWDCENLVMYPHCADVDAKMFSRCVRVFETNLKRWDSGQELINICDKKKGY